MGSQFLFQAGSSLQRGSNAARQALKVRGDYDRSQLSRETTKEKTSVNKTVNRVGYTPKLCG
jgi:hypothetical protein